MSQTMSDVLVSDTPTSTSQKQQLSLFIKKNSLKITKNNLVMDSKVICLFCELIVACEQYYSRKILTVLCPNCTF